MSDAFRLPDDQLEQLAELVAQRSRPRLVDAQRAAGLLGVPKSWVLAEARTDRIPHVRLGRYVRFDEDALVDWWTTRRHGPWRRRRDERVAYTGEPVRTLQQGTLRRSPHRGPALSDDVSGTGRDRA